jgi:alkylation response protein AidB-like acyl-CoA dehydrogenase
MDFEYTKEQKLIKSSAREVMEKEIIPLADEYDKSQSLLDRRILRELLDKISLLGYTGARVAEEDGGIGLSNVDYGILCEELWRAYASLGSVIQIQEGSARQLSRLGTPQQKEKFLPKLISGKCIACIAITEPDAGSDSTGIQAEVILDGDHYTINGRKKWISNGSISDMAIVAAQNRGGSESSGICYLIVDRAISPYESIEIPKMGARSLSTSELVFKDCRVPTENLLATSDQESSEFPQILDAVESTLPAGMVGIAQAAIDTSVRYARRRYQFGKPIGGFQIIQGMIAEMVAHKEAARLLAYNVLSRMDKALPWYEDLALAKFYSTDMAQEVTSNAIQIHGAYGLSEEFPLERYYRDSIAFSECYGATEIKKLIVGSNILGLRAFA